MGYELSRVRMQAVGKICSVGDLGASISEIKILAFIMRYSNGIRDVTSHVLPIEQLTSASHPETPQAEYFSG